MIPDFFPPPRLRPDSSSSRMNFSRFLNAFNAFLSSSSVAIKTSCRQFDGLDLLEDRVPTQ